MALHYSQPSILVVDDEPHVLEALSTILEGRGYRVRVAPNGAMALGMFPEAIFSEQHVELADGDALVVFSDGLTEAMNGNDEFFGDDRLRAGLPVLAGMSAEALGTRVVAAVDEFVGDRRPHDDLSLVVLRRVS